MKITQLRVTNECTFARLGPGTGKVDKQEVYPCTPELLIKLGIKESTILKLQKMQQQSMEIDDSLLEGLRDYQKEDVKYLALRKSAGCFNEQRTGKTPTALTVMKVKGIKKLLIIAPASTLYNWSEECKRWFNKDAPVYVVDGQAHKRKKIIDNWKTGVLIISYECLRLNTRVKRDEYGDISELEEIGDINYIKLHKDIDGCILDEAHRIKNHKSRQAEALFSLSDIPIRLALSGTPAPGKQHEIYSILHWLYPTIFTGYWRFIDYYFDQFEEYGRDRTYKVIGTFKRGKNVEMQQFLSAISTRRMRASVMPWLPDKDRQVVKLPQTKEQVKYIKKLNENFEIEGTEVDAINILAKIMKVRQILLAPKLLDLKGTSPKITWIKQYIADYPEKNILIFSNFTEWLKLLGKELNCKNFIIGETSKKDRELLKKQFQDGKIKLLLINIKAGKEGITLDNADTAIFTDKYPPVGDVQQAEDRFVATTKDKLHTGHTIIDLVMDHSYEMNILKMLESNASEVDLINNYVAYIKKGGGVDV